MTIKAITKPLNYYRQAGRVLIAWTPVIGVLAAVLLAAGSPLVWSKSDADPLSAFQSVIPSKEEAIKSVEAPSFQSSMTPMTEEELADVSGQALFFSDYIAPNSLTGQQGANSVTDFGFYRMGLDVDMEFNLNISKLQLGCGGFNDGLDASVCDIDMDYVRFLGLDPNNSGQPDPAGPASDFLLRRPYISLAVENPGALNREIAGIKIGAQLADGYVSVGRTYAPGQSNQENGGAGCTSATRGPGQLACQSGINSISGFLGSELSATFDVNCASGAFCATVSGPVTTCVGNTAAAPLNQNIDGCSASIGDAVFLDIQGTRMTELFIQDQLLGLDGGGFLVDLLSGGEGFVQLRADLRNLHGFALDGTSDFFLSFQRQRIAWPRFNLSVPNGSTASSNRSSCNPNAVGAVPDRCSSAYAVPANTGWWMNVPEVKVLGIQGGTQDLAYSELAESLDSPGLLIENPDLQQSVAPNCYDGEFC
jgi:hypothetical protein